MPDPEVPRTAYQVLVAGSMNPAAHHPQWYKSIGAIDSDELNASLKNGTNGTTPLVSRVEFGSPNLSFFASPTSGRFDLLTPIPGPRCSA